MKVAVGSDHAGFEIKARVLEWLERLGHEPEDFGTHSAESCDYPVFAEAVGHAVARGEAQRGVLICGTGIGMSMAANKVHGIRAAVCHGIEAAELSRRHNDANVLCLGARINTPGEIESIVRHWFDAEFEGGRHARRIARMMAIEEAECATAGR
ncbi:MAG: ribose 5-phosphate isomerase B [Planctomycetota bacterium]|nr:MAG: ribose 5-phosphate isomerase B [Planctomycetota bacterium]